MPSAIEPTNKSPRVSRLCDGCKRWNRKLHFCSGLFLLLFLWLFAFTGLLLNHPSWSFAESISNRYETNYVQAITAPGPEMKGDLSLAHEIMRQLEINGQILWTTTRTNASQFDFQVRRPGDYFFLSADLARQSVTVRHWVVNLWGVIKVLHTFTGVQMEDARQSRDWALTSMWAYTMDGVAAGLVFMVLSSLYMWWELPQKRVTGAVAIGLGSVICGLFCVGLRWMF
jgi:hypothetical protein